MTELLSTMPQIPLTGGFVVRFEAIDPVTGAAVTGVKVSNVALYGETSSGQVIPLGVEPAEPLFVPIPADAIDGVDSKP